MRRASRSKKHYATVEVPSRSLWRWTSLGAILVLIVLLLPRIMGALMPDWLTWSLIGATARGASVLVRAAGLPCTLAEGNHLLLTHHVFRIDAACTGGLWLAAYALCVAAMPVSGRRKGQGLLIGLPALIAFNFVRLVLAAAVSENWPSRFYFVHDRVLQGAFVLVTVALWAAWMFLSRNDWKPGWD